MTSVAAYLHGFTKDVYIWEEDGLLMTADGQLRQQLGGGSCHGQLGWVGVAGAQLQHGRGGERAQFHQVHTSSLCTQQQQQHQVSEVVREPSSTWYTPPASAHNNNNNNIIIRFQRHRHNISTVDPDPHSIPLLDASPEGKNLRKKLKKFMEIVNIFFKLKFKKKQIKIKADTQMLVPMGGQPRLRNPGRKGPGLDP